MNNGRPNQIVNDFQLYNNQNRNEMDDVDMYLASNSGIMMNNNVKWWEKFSPTIMEAEVPQKFINIINANFI